MQSPIVPPCHKLDILHVHLLRPPFLLVLDFLGQDAHLLIAAPVNNFHGERRVLELTGCPHVQENVNDAGTKREDVRNENENVTDYLRVTPPGNGVKNAGYGDYEIDSSWVLRLQDSLHALQNENVLTHAHSRRYQSISEGVSLRTAHIGCKYYPDYEPR